MRRKSRLEDRITIRVGESLLSKVERQAEEMEVKPSTLVRMIVKNWFSEDGGGQHGNQRD